MPTVVELKQMCRNKGIKGYSKMRKAELEKLCIPKSQRKRKSNKRVSAPKPPPVPAFWDYSKDFGPARRKSKVVRKSRTAAQKVFAITDLVKKIGAMKHELESSFHDNKRLQSELLEILKMGGKRFSMRRPERFLKIIGSELLRDLNNVKSTGGKWNRNDPMFVVRDFRDNTIEHDFLGRTSHGVYEKTSSELTAFNKALKAKQMPKDHISQRAFKLFAIKIPRMMKVFERHGVDAYKYLPLDYLTDNTKKAYKVRRNIHIPLTNKNIIPYQFVHTFTIGGWDIQW